MPGKLRSSPRVEASPRNADLAKVQVKGLFDLNGAGPDKPSFFGEDESNQISQIKEEDTEQAEQPQRWSKSRKSETLIDSKSPMVKHRKGSGQSRAYGDG